MEVKLNAAQQLHFKITGYYPSPLPVKNGARPTKFHNAKRKRFLMASTYHQNPARTYAEALAEDAKRMGVQP